MSYSLIRPACLLALFAPVLSFAAEPAPAATLIAQGRHLVDDVGLCADCHTPRFPTGEFDRGRWLQGAPLGFKPLFEMPWMPVAPPLAGLPGYTDEQAIKFFMTGERPSGVPVLPPMPAYRFNKEEATAVLAYLRSLKPAE
jgi:hypothetical protein